MRGESVVDISFASPALSARVVDWRVEDGVETYSDHRYIRFDVSAQVPRTPVQTGSGGPRWALKQLDPELLQEASMVQAWVSSPSRPVDIDDEAEWFQHTMTHICDVAMPRVQPGRGRRQVYWWSQEIEALRRACMAARRRCARHRRLRIQPPDAAAREAELFDGYRAAKGALRTEIRRAKERARAEMLGTLDVDPWGRPYKMVRNKLRTWAPPLTQSLRPELVERVVNTLFPMLPEYPAPEMVPPSAARNEDNGNEDVPEVTRVELRAAVYRLKAKNTAPGPDGIPGRAWVFALEALWPRLKGLLSACLERGQFPLLWKTGRLVLIRKPGRPAESPSAYRPIVLLDEVGKLLERVIANRLVGHLARVGPDLAESQYGFRRGRSTVDAIMHVGALVKEEVVSQGGVALAVSLDIANAFNTLPWSCIREALRYHRVPAYLRHIIEAYLLDRAIIYPGSEVWHRREMSCGVPQGSVLGPLLWNIGYDWVLRGNLPREVSVTCYADDTLVLARGKSYQATVDAAASAVVAVVDRIRRLGLEVALSKSEAIYFHGPRRSLAPGSQLEVGGVHIGVGSTMRYLGLVLDSRWNFGEHFRRLAPKLQRTAAALKRLLPNLGGPNASCRRLYAGVVRSMALYGAPVWIDHLAARGLAQLHAVQRQLAVRLIRGYRTVSFEAASLLAGLPPWDLEARLLAQLYGWRVESLRRGVELLPSEIATLRAELRRDLMASWGQRLLQPRAGHATIEAVRPVFERWLERRHGIISFRLAQVLTGHGCFGKYLHRIRRDETSGCHHCEDRPEDTVHHTVAECSAWAEQRSDLTAAIGGSDLSLPTLVQAIVGSERAWDAVSSFCDVVLSAKEEAERARQRLASRPGRRRGRPVGQTPGDDLRPP